MRIVLGALWAMLAILPAILGVRVSASPYSPVPRRIARASASPEVDLSIAEARFVALINAERTARGENALVVDPLLQNAAREHSREMCVKNYFDHMSPTPGLTTPMDRYEHAMHVACRAIPASLEVGENIYYSSVFDAHYNVDYCHQTLMHSPGHRANILDPQFNRIGVGAYRDASGQFWVTQMFLAASAP